MGTRCTSRKDHIFVSATERQAGCRVHLAPYQMGTADLSFGWSGWSMKMNHSCQNKAHLHFLEVQNSILCQETGCSGWGSSWLFSGTPGLLLDTYFIGERNRCLHCSYSCYHSELYFNAVGRILKWNNHNKYGTLGASSYITNFQGEHTQHYIVFPDRWAIKFRFSA